MRVTAHPAPELDHLVCVFDDPDQPSHVLERDGWVLDAGTAHVGQGTRSRAWPGGPRALPASPGRLTDPLTKQTKVHLLNRA